jgi:glucose/arabinose dehydrogenase
MWSTALLGVVLIVATTDAITTQACSRSEAPGSPSPTPPTTPSPEVFTTQDGVRFVVETPVSALDVPWSMAFAPDNRLFLTERAGRVRILNIATMTAELALTLDGVYTQSEAGLLGIALDPDFAQNRQVYLYYTAVAGSAAVNRVLRFRETGNRLTDRVTVLDNIPAASIHDGGRLRFGPDRRLYITIGDAANTSLAQDLSSYAGKILRIDTDGTSPRDNPFSSPVFSYGHRNPQGLAVHPETGAVWVEEHGPRGGDEVNVVTAGTNYGWPVITYGRAYSGLSIGEGSEKPGMAQPIYYWVPSISPSGMAFYQGDAFPQWQGDLFVGALSGELLARLELDGEVVTQEERLLEGVLGRIRDVRVGPDGYLYLLTDQEDGALWRLEPA